jgi:hypothetical protein
MSKNEKELLEVGGVFYLDRKERNDKRKTASGFSQSKGLVGTITRRLSSTVLDSLQRLGLRETGQARTERQQNGRNIPCGP